METTKEIKATYIQLGNGSYPEDTFSKNKIINNERDLFLFMKEMLKKSAANFSSYPSSHLFRTNSIEFYEREVLIIDGKKFKTSWSIINRPEYFKESEIKFYEWYKFVKERFPRLQRARNNRLKEEKELRLLSKLKDKYNQ